MNLEVRNEFWLNSNLMQRLESHRGVVILATSRRDNIDDAFIRCLRFAVEFPVKQP